MPTYPKSTIKKKVLSNKKKMDQSIVANISESRVLVFQHCELSKDDQHGFYHWLYIPFWKLPAFIRHVIRNPCAYVRIKDHICKSENVGGPVDYCLFESKETVTNTISAILSADNRWKPVDTQYMEHYIFSPDNWFKVYRALLGSQPAMGSIVSGD